MPEATVLYTVTAVVVLGLIVWVAVVLKTAREPWARPHAARHSGIQSLPPAESRGAASNDAEAAPADAAKVGADSTAKATPVALAGGGNAKAGATDEDADP